MRRGLVSIVTWLVAVMLFTYVLGITAGEAAASELTPPPPMQGEYLLLLDITSMYGTPEEQMMQTQSLLFPYLSEAVQQGQLETFQLLPELVAIQLVAPEQALLAQVASWPGARAVAPLNPRTLQAATEHAGTMRQMSLQHAPKQLPETQTTPTAPMETVGVGGLTSFTVYEDENEVYGYVITPSLNLTVTLMTGSNIKSQIATVANSSGYFRAYFTDIIRGGDVIQINLPGAAPILVDVVLLTLEPDKASDVIRGTAPANATVYLGLYSYTWQQSYWQNVIVDAMGQFSGDFRGIADIFLGDEVDLEYRNPNGFFIYLRNRRVPGLSVYLTSNYVWGYATSGVTVNLVLKDSTGTIKASTEVRTQGGGYGSSNGYFSTYFDPTDPCATRPQIVLGDWVEMQYGAQPTATVQVVQVGVDAIHVVDDVVVGHAPANSKVEVYARDGYTAQYATKVVTTSAAGQYNASFSSIVDLALGSYATSTYHDTQDNEVSGISLYAGPYVNAYLNYYNDLWVAAHPNTPVTATLRTTLGVIKGTAQGIANSSGYLYLYFYDSAGLGIDIAPGDRVEVDFGAGVTRIVETTGIDFIVDRDTRTVYGTGPTNTNLQVIYDSSDSKMVTTTATGTFTATFGWMSGGASVQVIYRNAVGNDLTTYGYVPQFTVYPDSNQVSGYGPARQAAVITVKDAHGIIKGSSSTTTGNNGFYSFYWGTTADVDIAFGDTVIIDVGPLHYEQKVVTLTIEADTINNIVYGTVPSGAWLNVYASRNFGPYYASYYRYFYADYAGNFATNFQEGADIRGGDSLTVRYWEGNFDQVYISRVAPSVAINHFDNRVYGYAQSGAVGTVTIRDSGGALKASITVTASSPSGYFNVAPRGVDMVPGDRVVTQIGALDQTDIVVPMSGSLDLINNRATGAGLPDNVIGVEIYHWTGSGYSNSTNGRNLRWFLDTDASGAFNVDLGCLADLTSGDYLGLYYMDAQDTHYFIPAYTTQPTITVDSYPAAVQPGAPVEVQFTIADGVHPTSVYIYWDTVSHDEDNAYRRSVYIQQGIIGQNVGAFNAPTAGVAYFKVRAYVDGQTVWSTHEYTVIVEGNVATTLVDPVSGTTNDNTPDIKGVAPPNALVTLYKGSAVVMTTTAALDGHFTFAITQPLTTGLHLLHAAATVSNTIGPNSNIVHLTVSPPLLVDPVHILLTSRGITQHLRDESGYANLGGRIWTRSGDVVAVAIPIRDTDLYKAELYVGGVLATQLLNRGDGVYVGTYSPPTSGSYAVVIKLQYESSMGTIYDITLLTGLIDPDGYVYDVEKGTDYRISGAIVTCYELVDETNDRWQVWNAAAWEQTNPQTVSADGYYSFFTLPGKYKIAVSAAGYTEYESPVLTVLDAPVHHNIGLRLIRYVYLPLVIRSQ
ncbi:MAG: hypothetical protein JXR84_19020 [Anaerolineae bacterium]|nr:hypothetical protein [Anaerolineae bacterium]